MNTARARAFWLLLTLLACQVACVHADDILLKVEDSPEHGLVIADVDLTAAVDWCGLAAIDPTTIQAWKTSDNARVPVQFVPGTDFDPKARVAGTLILKLPSDGDAELRLAFDGIKSAAAKEPFDGTVQTPSCRVTHSAGQMGGLPASFEFKSGKIFDHFRWNDRVYDRGSGSFTLASDREAEVQLVSPGPLATVVRTSARYMQSNKQPDSRPKATYDWCYLKELPLVRVTATATQQSPGPWSEAHFLELNFPGDDFTHWAGGEPLKQGAFEGKTETFDFDGWGALVEGQDAIGMLDCGRAMFYDHRGGSYLQSHGSEAWQDWSQPSRHWAAWLWIGSDDDVVDTVRSARTSLPTQAAVHVTIAQVDQRIAAARRDWAATTGDARRRSWWHAAGAAQLAGRGRFQDALATAAGQMPDDWSVFAAGDLGMIVRRETGGIQLLSLFDVQAGKQLASPSGAPLFELTIRNVTTDEEVQLDADAGWGEVKVTPATDRQKLELRWAAPVEKQLGNVEVIAVATADPDTSSIAWRFSAATDSKDWSIWSATFPKIAVNELAPQSTLFVPRAAGQLENDAWRRVVKSNGRYPSGWMSMQYMAAYAADGSTGLYVGLHDPFASTKEIVAESRPDSRQVVLLFEHPVPGMGKPGNRFELCGQAVWRRLGGDWFDAALIYRDWVRRNAKWYPKLSAEGREDTPRWMRELCVWALGGGDPKTGLPVLQEFAEKMGLPIGFHWYSWHQIPFDNDYPHYFPADEGFTDAVALLQKKNIYVMPYINGRLWDTRDKGMEDFEFSKLALAAATKDEHGEPYTESYSSKETDGSKVELAAMCPSTALWQDTVRKIVLRLMNECGVRGVYIDQVAAAKPRLCFDASHGHPSGGGHWWTESYWKMLDAIRRAMPHDRILTTECNAEPYIKSFDGYLTWHWQYDGQVPAFPAVYGGSLQMFGRAYRGGPTKDLALRMKAGQQLVFGEQIGWIGPQVVREEENFAFLRQVVHLRHRFVRYFYAGQMARPPRLGGEIPKVTADWQWHGVWPVTTDAAMSGAWQLPDEGRTVLLMVNVADEPIDTWLELDAADYGISGDRAQVAVVGSDGQHESFTVDRQFRRDLTLPPRTAVAWELTPAK